VPSGRSQQATASGIHLPAMTAGVTIRGNTFRHFHSGVSMDGSVDLIDLQHNRFEDCSIGAELSPMNLESLADPIVRVNEVHNTFTRTDVPTKGLDQPQRRNF